MKICEACKIEFNPFKSYYRVCNSCFPICVCCKTCKKLSIPNNENKIICCGYVETMEDITRNERILRNHIRDVLSDNNVFKPIEDYSSINDLLEDE